MILTSDQTVIVLYCRMINPFPKTPFWDRPKFKEAADNNWNVAIKRF